ncbi:MAG: hypothetical protein NZ602_08315 [Thermoguttaceae bacterium]|nr:hypothetical protein [Thermoguttaceae bacterium]MDW8037284.1 hypothetical protein [Thermoguttaceae bacterium]
MHRREFLKLSSIGPTVAMISQRAQGAAAPGGRVRLIDPAPPILASYGAEEHRRRLQNIAQCRQAIRRAMRTHLVTDYLPGQCVYNLGEYPCRKPWDPDDWDEQELDKLQKAGIRLIQVHEEWNDALRLWGSHKLAPLNPKGFRRFVEMVHRRHMKLIVYVSSGYFSRHDPEFRPEWAGGSDLREIYWHYARCSPASPGWRAYFLPRVLAILDEYGVDGIYNDLGYYKPGSDPRRPAKDEVLAFEETPSYDGALEDLLALLYAEVKRRGGIVKVHLSGTRRPQTMLKIYDYLWVGEGIGDADRLRETTKDYPPYVVPCLDMSRARIENEDELYLHTIPYMQFPLLLAGRPFTGERAVMPGIEYPPEDQCFWTRHVRAIWRHYQAHPNGPFSYGWWDSVPGRPEAQPTHAKWLKLYLPMVEEGTWAWLEVQENSLLKSPLPQDVCLSVFANREIYLVLANFGQKSHEVQTAALYVSMANPNQPPGNHFVLPRRSLTILRQAASVASE